MRPQNTPGYKSKHRKPIAERFWSKVQKTDGCWIWTASRTLNGYGQIGNPDVPTRLSFAHRVSWELHFGPIPPGMYVCHHCDNPACVRPDHLFLGTAHDNHTDMVRKGRSTAGDRNPARLYPDRVPRGERHPWRLHPERIPHGEQCGSAKLTESKVREIRQLADSGVPHSAIARMFDVCQASVLKIARRQSWRHVA